MTTFSPQSQTNSRIYTVSSLNAQVRLVLENEMGVVWLIGELSNFSMPVSGHWYFTLKDSRAQVKCAMFKGNNRHVTFKPANGNQVLVKARLSLYEPRGDYQLIIESMQPEGDGRLQQQFEQLKISLAAEGLFAQSLKQTLPEQPKRVGIITSKTGAALHDILQVLQRRDPSLPIVIYPTMVQGEGSAISIAQAIGRANARQECDVLIVGRGGGSLEDLWAFNEEIVARTIAASQIPIVSAVGHEVDVTIADFVADVRAPTPSAAAELISRDMTHQTQLLDRKKQQLHHAIRSYLSQSLRQATQLQHRLERQHPQLSLNQQQQHLDEISQRLVQAMQKKIQKHQQHIDSNNYKISLYSPATLVSNAQRNLERSERRLYDALDRKLLNAKHKLAVAAEKLETVSPLATLARGYSITRNEQGDVIRNTSQVQHGDKLITTVTDGDIHSCVIK
ncbi:exodeoxyribonuclease VII large subunit [Photobacterium angustum]|uniref:Exodeoxyribonuclease 7 large subunit n=1 Tax=Photobacterium angustum TaxID=661 RepID=A0A855SFP7_PHOAN|nr:exodeoxyribonuclease VII large subunit [Photobacterium angustum]KJF82967.1 exodeoxyribonuclease VII large subunit [Photobacterium damselae subsp. damselae]KJG27170.1 exodeoxyribonuclease VII large subunit [Photobacterium angustum]KJG42320.1 exodeoxyribonuclease VII large subunit [Photobacterium angustum]KJG47106.1 exodeoxyribonuclease VII large subunit [Photobacterium angustum]KJG51168.1 exodeoxyribonuclease VII large subunit [Photobacterium angustum]